MKKAVFLMLVVVLLAAALPVYAGNAAGSTCGRVILAQRLFIGDDAGIRASRWGTAMVQRLTGDCDVRWRHVGSTVSIIKVSILGW